MLDIPVPKSATSGIPTAFTEAHYNSTITIVDCLIMFGKIDMSELGQPRLPLDREDHLLRIRTALCYREDGSWATN